MRHALAAMLFALLFLAFPQQIRADSAFLPGAATVTLAATGTTSRVAVATSSFNSNIRFYNSGTVAVFIACGDVTVVATTASLPIIPGTVEVLGCPGAYVAGITAGTAATLYLTPGAGL